jgi:molybdate transport system regulatory protein
MDTTSYHLRSKLALDTEFGAFLGDTRIRLLEAIEIHGSISQAAKAVPLSYKAAWDAVDAMNNLAEHPIVLRTTGGKHGGGTQLTDYGRRMVNLYRALEVEYQTALDRVSASMREGDAGDLGHFQQVIRRMAMKTSARNQFAGQVCGLREGVVDFEVRLRLDPDNEIVAVITRDSAENLELTIGKPVVAMVKSSSVLLLTDPNLKTSARNHLWGEVTRLQEGPVNSEVNLMLPGGKTVCSVVTHESVETLGLTLGSRACAVFKASSVILSTYA